MSNDLKKEFDDQAPLNQALITLFRLHNRTSLHSTLRMIRKLNDMIDENQKKYSDNKIIIENIKYQVKKVGTRCGGNDLESDKKHIANAAEAVKTAEKICTKDNRDEILHIILDAAKYRYNKHIGLCDPIRAAATGCVLKMLDRNLITPEQLQEFLDVRSDQIEAHEDLQELLMAIIERDLLSVDQILDSLQDNCKLYLFGDELSDKLSDIALNDVDNAPAMG